MRRPPKATGLTLVGFATAVALAACSSPATSPQANSSGSGAAPAGSTQLRIGIVPTLQSFYPSLAIQKGFFKKYGLEASLVTVQTGPALVTALIGGSTDVSMAGPQLLWPALKKGADIKVLIGAVKLNYELVACPGTQTPNANQAFPGQLADIKGKSIGVIGPGTQTETFAKKLVAAAGLSEGDVQLKPVGGSATSIPACKEKRVDFVVLNPPQDLQLGTEGTDYKVIASALDPATSGTLFSGFYADTYATTNAYIKSSPQGVTGFCKGLKDARTFATDPANLSEVAQLFAKDQNIPAAKAADAWKQAQGTLLIPITEAAWAKQGQAVIGDAKTFVPSYKDFVYPECSQILGSQ